jgi:predicted dehydrogenase
MKIAQLGYGYWGRNLLRVFGMQKGVEIALCCETEKATQKILAKAEPGIEICADISAVADRKDVEAVVIATPAALHYSQAKMMIQAGKHVFVEKPMARTTAEAEELVALSESMGKVLMVGHTFLYNDAVRWVKKYIEKGEMGDVYYAYFQRLSLGRVRQDVNALLNLAPHDVSIALYWMDELPNDVQAQGMSFLQPGIDDVSFMNLRFPSGRSAHIHVSWIDPFKTRRAVIVGSRSMVVYDDTASDHKITIFNKGIDRFASEPDIGSTPFQNFGQFNLIHRVGDIVIPKLKFREPLEVEAAHFIECVREKKRPLTDARHGLEVVRVLEMAQRGCVSTGKESYA